MLAACLDAGGLSEPERPLQETTLAAQEAQIQRLEGTLQHYRNWAAQVSPGAISSPNEMLSVVTWLPSGCTEGALAPPGPDVRLVPHVRIPWRLVLSKRITVPWKPSHLP